MDYYPGDAISPQEQDDRRWWDGYLAGEKGKSVSTDECEAFYEGYHYALAEHAYRAAHKEQKRCTTK
jgi:hypothetical protein